jgi:hypothetical protein
LCTLPSGLNITDRTASWLLTIILGGLIVCLKELCIAIAKRVPGCIPLALEALIGLVGTSGCLICKCFELI